MGEGQCECKEKCKDQETCRKMQNAGLRVAVEELEACKDTCSAYEVVSTIQDNVEAYKGVSGDCLRERVRQTVMQLTNGRKFNEKACKMLTAEINAFLAEAEA